ncbi:(E2-independent) E3 ubiquitin-conjugating enzyme FATS isoform X2 [Meles meles]|uniref:(E2-independent) E3 ubiquitin-conjugating enzyme FATS isoform X2 n=1 Tax=Meles meles TaxID=9662 RepID=UPI001E69ED35|nr:(E2-independent) E3 ubiquitin-conjugating enzyme FATS isoform X2 [Meles meles]XP_045883309.1 (E2-independent) E3 ubiquitin-conjugating enzyme FATS isoform X2 [Meles meles]
MSLKCQWNMIKLSEEGLRDKQYSTKNQIALKNLQSDVTEKKSDFTEGTLASQNTEMISPLVISPLFDESNSKVDRAAPPAPPAPCTPALHVHPARPSPGSRPGVSISRALGLLPGGLGTPTPAAGPGPDTEPPRSAKPGSGPQRGFASITITARRVGAPASAAAWEAVRDPRCPECGARGAPLRDAAAPAGGADPRGHRGPFACADFSRNGSVMRLRVPETDARLCGGPQYCITDVDSRESSFPPGAARSGEGPLVFSSCVHVRVTQPCPNSIYYLDRSLSVPVELPQLAGPKMHRSVLSLSLKCSSHGPTADGAGGPANAGPLRGAREPALLEGNQSPLGPGWNPGLQGSFLQEIPSLEQVHLEPGTCPWRGSCLLEKQGFSSAAVHQVTGRKGREDYRTTTGGGSGTQLSIHIPGWSYTAVEAKVFSGSSEKQQGEARVTLSAPPVEQKLVKEFLPDGYSSPSNSRQSSNFSEPSESQQQSFLKSGIPLSGFPCPLPDSCTSPQEDSDVQIEREIPAGDYKCCDLVVKIKECGKSEEPEPASPEPASPKPAPPKPVPLEPEPPEPPESPDLSEDCPEGLRTPAGSLTLQEALEVQKPQFISRSQERLKKLEHMVQQRKAQRKENLGRKQSLFPVRANKKQFTVPHPLSDNLFKPKERYISEKEMHMRSKRIYNNLPEVKKKKEEQKKRVLLQSNRLRAEVFKKQLLDQLLQRNAV